MTGARAEEMTHRTVLSFAGSTFVWLLPLLGAGACGSETHIVATMDPDVGADGAAGGDGAAGAEGTTAPAAAGASNRESGDTGTPPPLPECGPSCCNDGVRDGAETSIDCGGPICNPCAFGALCQLSTDCLSGSCDPDTRRCIPSCAPGTDECDGDPSVECETNLLTSVVNCGTCGRVCDLPHSVAMCSRGQCVADECDEGFGDCNGKAPDGCESQLESDVRNCGRCGQACSAAHGVAACLGAACKLTSCDIGWGNCDADEGNGCESDLSSPTTCGSCDQACQSGQACRESRCVTP